MGSPKAYALKKKLSYCINSVPKGTSIRILLPFKAPFFTFINPFSTKGNLFGFWFFKKNLVSNLVGTWQKRNCRSCSNKDPANMEI